MRKIMFFICLFTSIFSIPATAQNSMGETLKAQLIKDWERAKAYTSEYLNAMPAEKYDFRAHDSIRSFAQQMLHLAQGNAGLAANGTGKPRAAWAAQNLEGSPGAVHADSVKYYVMAGYDFAIEGIKSMDAVKLEEKVKRGSFDETRLSWLLKAFEHQTHHRGQTTIYIRLLGIKPPNEKLF